MQSYSVPEEVECGTPSGLLRKKRTVSPFTRVALRGNVTLARLSTIAIGLFGKVWHFEGK